MSLTPAPDKGTEVELARAWAYPPAPSLRDVGIPADNRIRCNAMPGVALCLAS